MSESSNERMSETPMKQAPPDAAVQKQNASHDQVRTEGETDVDDALGSADDPL
ncbi:MAG TPA: hypothetical protein VGD71_29465 [Kribbella sp.]|jgi:hypothetical protein